MNKQQLFTKAHQKAKAIRTAYNSYRSAFAAALKQLWSKSKMVETFQKVQQMTEALLTGKFFTTEWEGNFICSNNERVQIYGEKTMFSAKQEEIINRLYSDFTAK